MSRRSAFFSSLDLQKYHADIGPQAAKSLLDGKASVSSVGDLYVLPFAEDIGLNI